MKINFYSYMFNLNSKTTMLKKRKLQLKGNKSKFRLVMLFVVLGLLQNTFAQENDNKVLITIGGDKVTVAEFMNVYQKNNVKGEVLDKKSLEDYLDLYINFKLKVKEAEDIGLDTVKAFNDELKGYRKQLAQPYFIDEKVTEELLKEAYQRKLIDIRASHILIKIDQNAAPADTIEAYNKILEVEERLSNGEDFGELAIELSDDPTAKDMEAIPGQRPFRKGNGGDLGYFTVFDMLYPFEEGSYNTNLGEVSDIVRTKYGYHLIKVTDIKEAMGIAQVAHIYIAMPKDASPEDSLNKKNKIYEIYKELLNGASFENMVKKYSEDRGSVEKGGELTKFGVSRMVPEFIVEIYDLSEPDDISEPILTSYGWHILKLINKKKPGTYDEEKNALNQRLLKDARSYKSKESIINNIKKEFIFKEYPKAKIELLAVIDSTILVNNWDVEKAKGLNKALFKLEKNTYTQFDFAKYLAANQKGKHTETVEVYFNNTYNNFVNKSCIDYFDSNLEEKYPDFKLLMKEYRDGILLFELTDQKVWSKAIKDTAGLNAFYKKNKCNYMWDKRLYASIYTVNEPEIVEELRQQIYKYSRLFMTDSITFSFDGYKKAFKCLSTDDILNKYNNDSVINISIETDIFSNDDNYFTDNINWEEGISDNFKSDIGNSVSFVYVYQIIKPEPKSLDEAKGLITAGYQTYLEKEWIKSLKEKYPVFINKSVLELINN